MDIKLVLSTRLRQASVLMIISYMIVKLSFTVSLDWADGGAGSGDWAAEPAGSGTWAADVPAGGGGWD